MSLSIPILFRKLPEFKGKKRLARLLFGRALKTKDIAVKGIGAINYLLPNIVENIGFDIFVNGVYEPGSIEFICNRIEKNGIILDIGANIGAICIPVKNRRSDIDVLAIEASPKVFKYLQHNIDVNQAAIKTLNRAVAEREGETVAIFSPDHLFGKGSQSAVYTKDSELVETVCIDQLLVSGAVSKISFIKIDIEGYEYFAFRGAASLLSGNDAPDILFEFNFSSEDHAKGVLPGDAQDLLRSYGYTIYKLEANSSLLLQKDTIVEGSFLLFASKRKV